MGSAVTKLDPEDIREKAPVRRLVAVAFIDVVGYTRLMEQDEPGTYRDWIALRCRPSNRWCPITAAYSEWYR